VRTLRRATAARKTGTVWERLKRMSDAEIRSGLERDPDVRPTDEAFWKGARLVLPEPKESITIRLDADVLRFFRREKRYQTKINAVLRSYMRAQRSG